MNHLEILALASDAFGARLDAVGPDGWEKDSTCTEWTVRDVCDHVIGGNRFAVALLEGRTCDEALEAAVRPGFSGDPLALYAHSATEQTRAFSGAGVLDNIVDHPVGPLDAGQFLGLRICDLLVHSWDIARSIGGDEIFDDQLIGWVSELMTTNSALIRASIVDGHARDVATGAATSEMQKILLFSGRTP